MDHRSASSIGSAPTKANNDRLADPSTRLFRRWRVAARHLLSAGARGTLVCRVSLEPIDGVWPDWRAGDEVETRATAARANTDIDAREFRGGLQTAPYAAAALLPAGHPVEPRTFAADAVTSTWPIASLSREGTLDLLLTEDRSGANLSEIPDFLLTGVDLDLRIRRRPSFHLHDGRRVLVADSFGLATARVWLAEAVGNPRSDLTVLLLCPRELADAALGDDIRSLAALGRCRLELLAEGSESEKLARALRRVGHATGGGIADSAPVMIAGRADLSETVWDAICGLANGAPRASGQSARPSKAQLVS